VQVGEVDNLAALRVPGLFPVEPGMNSFSYNPPGTYLREEGFTITIIAGAVEESFLQFWTPGSKRFAKSSSMPPEFFGSVMQFHHTHIAAGYNTQIETDAKPIQQIYTFLSQDAT
jgi:hypothetical protein